MMCVRRLPSVVQLYCIAYSVFLVLRDLLICFVKWYCFLGIFGCLESNIFFVVMV